MKRNRDTEKNNGARWEMLNEAMTHFLQYISQKPVKASLSIVDPLHVSKFKGGNASITEPIGDLDEKLKFYEGRLNLIEQIFGQKNMGLLDQQGVGRLIELCDGFLALTKSSRSNIRGFGPFYASALLAAHFPDLIPILDRRVLNGAGIQTNLNSVKQVKNIDQYYGELVRACWTKLRTQSGMSLRELDKEWFVKSIVKSRVLGVQRESGTAALLGIGGMPRRFMKS